jgi:hypothetical protein
LTVSASLVAFVYPMLADVPDRYIDLW